MNSSINKLLPEITDYTYFTSHINFLMQEYVRLKTGDLLHGLNNSSSKFYSEQYYKTFVNTLPKVFSRNNLPSLDAALRSLVISILLDQHVKLAESVKSLDTNHKYLYTLVSNFVLKSFSGQLFENKACYELEKFYRNLKSAEINIKDILILPHL